MVTVISGANEASSELAGQTVGSVRQAFRTPLNIPAQSRATVNGAAVEDNYVLREGDNLVFTKNTAQKG